MTSTPHTIGPAKTQVAHRGPRRGIVTAISAQWFEAVIENASNAPRSPRWQKIRRRSAGFGQVAGKLTETSKNRSVAKNT
jgi:hypothetical protein